MKLKNEKQDMEKLIEMNTRLSSQVDMVMGMYALHLVSTHRDFYCTSTHVAAQNCKIEVS